MLSIPHLCDKRKKKEHQLCCCSVHGSLRPLPRNFKVMHSNAGLTITGEPENGSNIIKMIKIALGCIKMAYIMHFINLN